MKRGKQKQMKEKQYGKRAIVHDATFIITEGCVVLLNDVVNPEHRGWQVQRPTYWT